MRGIFGRIFGGARDAPRNAPRDAPPADGDQRLSGLSADEFERIGTAEDPMRDYEEALERNFRGMEAEQRGDVSGAVSLYEQSIAGGFVDSHPYERLAGLHEQRREYGEALRVLESYARLAESGTMPRGAQRSAGRKMPEIQARIARYRRLVEGGGRDTTAPS